MVRRFATTALLCALAAGCGAASPTNQFGPSSVTTIAPSADGTNARFGTESIGSCPDGNAPTWLQPWTRGTTARLRWTEVAPIIEYHVVVERYDVTNRYVPVDNGDFVTINATWAEVTLSEGRYRAKIQTRSCGSRMGPWSEMLQFGVEGDSAASNEVPTVVESAEGTRVFPNATQSLIDSTGAVWTFGGVVVPGSYEVLRNGVYMSGWGSQLKYHSHAVYHLGSDSNWYFWNGAGWTGIGPVEP